MNISARSSVLATPGTHWRVFSDGSIFGRKLLKHGYNPIDEDSHNGEEKEGELRDS